MKLFTSIPQKFDSLRSVPSCPDYYKFIADRCTDLYSCPRIKVTKRDHELESSDLLPKIKLPSENENLHIEEKLYYSGHSGVVNNVAAHPNGLWLASSSKADRSIRVWNVFTGKCLLNLQFEHEVNSLSWLGGKLSSIITFSV